MNNDEFVDRVLARFTERITDEVFLTIEKTPELDQVYKQIVDRGDRDYVNQEIGRRVPAAYRLGNLGQANDPSSTLIQIFERHILL